MKFYEYKAKAVFAQYDIPTPESTLITDTDDDDALQSLPYPVALKSQVLIGGRGKAGGIKFADDEEEAHAALDAILGMDIRGYTVKKVLAERKLAIAREFYLGFVLDRSQHAIVMIASAEGGVEIEAVPEDKLVRCTIDPLLGIRPYQLRDAANALGLTGGHAKQFCTIAAKLYRLCIKEDVTLVEINPLVLTGDDTLVAADAKLVVDDDALFRHPDYRGEHEDLTPLEQRAKEEGIAFIQLEGDIGVIANGAGLTMATLDSLTHFHGDAGVFLDLGGTDNPEKVKAALRLMKAAEPSVILLNIFGGITKCDTVASGVSGVIEDEGIETPLVARIKGRNEEAGRQILQAAGIIALAKLTDAAAKAAELSNPTANAAKTGGVS